MALGTVTEFVSLVKMGLQILNLVKMGLQILLYLN